MLKVRKELGGRSACLKIFVWERVEFVGLIRVGVALLRLGLYRMLSIISGFLESF